MSSTKIGRNQSCPCGSGLKYKNCCLIREKPSFEEVRRIHERMMKEARLRAAKLASRGIFINFVPPVNFNDKKVFVLGNRLYPRQPKNLTFHEFILYVLRFELGKEWWMEQKGKKETEQHFIFKCFLKYYGWRKINKKTDNKEGEVWAAPMDGWTNSLISIAFDVCSLLQAVHLPHDFIKRLRDAKSFQSVRYEIAIASIFARLGYKIKFLDEFFNGEEKPPKHCEFIAIDKETGEKIAVEAKSKTRDGVFHTEGKFNLERELKSSLTKNYRRALEQNPGDKPFIVFIDVNLPVKQNSGPDEREWVTAVDKMRNRHLFTTSSNKQPTTAIVFTNHSFHYQKKEQSLGGEFLIEETPNPAFSIESKDLFSKLITALTNYGKVPNLDIDFFDT